MPLDRLSALSIAPAARDWLRLSRRVRWLHVFDHACNLMNERGEVLSIVSRYIGDGPFNLVIPADGLIFSNFLNVGSQITITSDRIILGDIRIDTQNVMLSSPRPDWESLHSHKDRILNQLISSPVIDYDLSIPDSLLSALFASVSTADAQSSCVAARKLAGLGAGLTPAGDDILLGAVLAARLIHPFKIATLLAEAIANTAAPLTTSLSAAWLMAAGKGDVASSWHQFFDALISEDAKAVQDSVDRILAVGHTSGADALAGFLGSLTFSPHIYDVPEYLH